MPSVLFVFCRWVEGVWDSYVKHVHSGFVDEEALKETLDHHQTFSQDQHHGVDPGAPSVEDGQKSELGKERKSEENEVHEKRYDRERQQSAEEERVELPVSEEVPDAAEGVRRRDAGTLQVADWSLHGTKQEADAGRPQGRL